MICRQVDEAPAGSSKEGIVILGKVQEEIYKRCPMCAAVWQDRMEFIGDTDLQIEGYQANFDQLEQGLVYFTHRVDGCYTTMAVKAREFLDLNPGKPFTSRKTMTDDCPGYCLHESNIERCSAECECAYVRDLLHILQTHKKAGGKSLGRQRSV